MPKKHPPAEVEQVQARFARHLAAAIRKDGRSQAEIARAVGLTPAAISHLLRGDRQLPGAITLLKLASELRESVAFLLGDRLPGRDSLEIMSRDLGAVLGGRRVRALLELDPDTLQDEADRVIGRHVDPHTRQRRKRR